jgi:hypothetical protein
MSVKVWVSGSVRESPSKSVNRSVSGGAKAKLNESIRRKSNFVLISRLLISVLTNVKKAH